MGVVEVTGKVGHAGLAPQSTTIGCALPSIGLGDRWKGTSV